jgi:hypothetical protein
MTTIYLIGDAILDNYYQLSDKQKDLRKELMMHGYTVHNYAVEDTKLYNVIHGIIPNDRYRKTRSYPYLLDETGKMAPLKLLLDHFGNTTFSSVYSDIGVKKQKPSSMVVLSIGGNDINANVMNILLGIDKFINSILTHDFISNYDKVITSIKKICDKIVICGIYLPYMGHGSSYAKYSDKSNATIKRINNFIFEMGKKHNIAVLDLSRTYDCQNRHHYGGIETHPSNVSNKCMADCISYIVNHYNGFNIFYAPNCDITKIKKE